MATDPEAPPPNFDEAMARGMVGKYVLIGLTYYDYQGQFVQQKQIHGRIVAADPRGIGVELKGVRDGETYWLPPDTRSFQDAAPGEYRLRSTGEVICNPDLLTTWIIDKPPPEPDPAAG